MHLYTSVILLPLCIDTQLVQPLPLHCHLMSLNRSCTFKMTFIFCYSTAAVINCFVIVAVGLWSTLTVPFSISEITAQMLEQMWAQPTLSCRLYLWFHMILSSRNVFCLYPSAIPLTAYGPMAAAAAVVRGMCAGKKLWQNKSIFLDNNKMFTAALCLCHRRHPFTHSWLPGHKQPRTNGWPLCRSQSGLRSQQLHQCCQPCPQHRVRTQSRGKVTHPF